MAPRSGAIDLDNEDPANWPEAHPLFPIEEGEKPPAIDFINVARYENGRPVSTAKIFLAKELISEQAIMEMWGGGLYELTGRSRSANNPDSPGYKTKVQRITLPGPPKPLVDGAKEEPKPIAAAATNPGSSDNMIVAILQMQMQQSQISQAAQQAQAQQQAESSRQFMTLMMQMMQSGKQEAMQMVTMMMQASQSQQQAMMQLLPALIGSRSGGPEEMAKYMQILKTLSPNKDGDKDDKEEFGLGKMLEDAADVVAGLAQLNGQAGGLAGAVASLNGGAAPAPGSAASVIMQPKKVELL